MAEPCRKCKIGERLPGGDLCLICERSELDASIKRAGDALKRAEKRGA